MAFTPAELQELAAKAKRLQTAAGSRDAHSLKDLLALQEYLDGQNSANGSALPIRIAKVKSGSTIPTGE